MKKKLYFPFIFDREKISTLSSIQRIDKDGTLYKMEYTADSGALTTRLPVKILRLIKSGGCSAFSVKNTEGHTLVGRNYDLAHLDKDKKPTGLNVVFTLNPKGKYRSINIADAAWISWLGLPYQKGALDNGKTVLSPLLIVPYLTMDGMNEKGLSASILALDIKTNEKPVFQREKGKKPVLLTELLRIFLDSASDIKEAEKIAKEYNLVNTFGNDYHIFLADRSGASAVFEWRYNSFKTVSTDAATNFYTGFEDAEDCYLDGKLKEKFNGPDETRKKYSYGYGHGFKRFGKIVKKLDEYREDAEKAAVMNEAEVRAILSDVSQNYSGELTSLTQYSVIYDHEALTATINASRDYSKKYIFRI